MSLTLTHWNQHGLDRVYLRGPDITGKTFLTLQRGRLKLQSDEYVDEPVIIALVHAMSGSAGMTDSSAWEAIKVRAQARPLHAVAASPAGPAPRGRAARTPSAPDTAACSMPATAIGAMHDLDISTIPIPGVVEFEVDHREPDALAALLARAPNAKVTRCALELGDVRINGRVLVERKTMRDFENSVIEDDKRLFNQAEKLAFEPETLAFVLLEGDPYTQRLRMTMQQITGALTYLSAIKGLSVLQVPDMTATAYTLAKIAQHERYGLGYNLGLRASKASALDLRCHVLEGLPGINAVLARRLLERFGSVAGVCAAGVAELKQVEGIGPTKAARIVEVTQAG